MLAQAGILTQYTNSGNALYVRVDGVKQCQHCGRLCPWEHMSASGDVCQHCAPDAIDTSDLHFQAGLADTRKRSVAS